MKIVLVRPYFNLYEKTYYEPPLSLLYPAAFLEKKGYQVSILDFLALGISDERRIREKLKKENPDIVGVTLLTYHRFEAIPVINIAKQLGAFVIVGGNHVTFDAENTLKSISSIDVAVLGEGEETMQELAEAIDRGGPLDTIKGIAYRQDGKIVINPLRPFIDNLDKLPFIPYHLLLVEKYRYLTVMGSRGCPYNCIFCAIPKLWQGKLRFRSYKLIVDEIEYLINTYGRRYFAFKDVNLFLDKKWAINLCNEIIKRDIKIKWDCLGRVDLRDEGIFRLMKKAGCEMIIFGVESASEETLNLIHKNITKGDVRMAVKMAREAGIECIQTTYMLGHPYETKKDIEETCNFAIELNSEQSLFGPTSIYPGTTIFDIAVKEKLLPSDFNWFSPDTLLKYKDGFRVYEGVPTWEERDINREYLEETARRFFVRTFLASIFSLNSFHDFKHFVFYYRARFIPKYIADWKVVIQEVIRELKTKRKFKKRVMGFSYIALFLLLFHDLAFTTNKDQCG